MGLHTLLPSPPLFTPPRCSPQQQRCLAAAAALERREVIDARLGIVGCGQMGLALVRGFIKAGVTTAGRISASVASLERQQLLNEMGINDVFDCAEQGGAAGVAQSSDIIIIGVRALHSSCCEPMPRGGHMQAATERLACSIVLPSQP